MKIEVCSKLEEDYSNQVFTEDFDCSKSNLTTLKGCPKEIYGSLECYINKLTTLEGCPEIIDEHFTCSFNQLTTLEGGPKKVGKSYDCSHNPITSLKGIPKDIGTHVDCSECEQLTDISDLPVTVESINISSCPNIKVFTKEIDNDSGKLLFILDEDDTKLADRIKSWPYYEVLPPNKYDGRGIMEVRIKPDNEQFINQL